MPHTIRLPYRSKSGAVFNIDPNLIPDIEYLVDQVTTQVETAKCKGKFFAYLSVPISNRGGGHFQTNTEMANSVTQSLTKKFGDELWVLNPAAYSLPPTARGGDYMAVWADVLAGSDGKGGQLDMVYFVGPTDVWSFFGANDGDRITKIARWLDGRASESEEYKKIAEDPELRSRFLRYYGIRGSTAYSKGAHDEWNIVVSFNQIRETGDDIAIYFDGVPIEPGDFDDKTDLGYELLLH